MINLAVICQLRLIQNYDIPKSVMIAHHLRGRSLITAQRHYNKQWTLEIRSVSFYILPYSIQMIPSMTQSGKHQSL